MMFTGDKIDSVMSFLAASFWLPALAVLVATVGAIFALGATVHRIRAERHYLRIIRSSAHAARVREMHARYIEDGRLSEDQLSELTGELEQLAFDSLDRRELIYVVHALKQPSPVGRERYIGKLLEAA
jgi:predicted LPLAT superfamily acyltransferase